MEVPIPQVFPQELDFTNPNVLFQESGKCEPGLVKFMESTTSILRGKFVPPDDHPNREAYEQVFDSSTCLVKNTLEMIWCEMFEWNDLKKDVLQLDEKRNELVLKFELFKSEMDELRKSNQSTFSKICEVFELVEGLRSDVDQLSDRIKDASLVFKKEANETMSKIAQLHDNIVVDGIGSQLQHFLLMCRLQTVLANADKWDEFVTLCQEKIDSVLRFNMESVQWLCGEAKRNKRSSGVRNRITLVLGVGLLVWLLLK